MPNTASKQKKAILEEIKKVEAHQDKMTFIADFLHIGGINGGEKYVTEAAQYLQATDAKAVSGGAHCNPSYWGPRLSGYSGSV